MSDPQAPQQSAAVITKSGGSASVQPSGGGQNALTPIEQVVATTSTPGSRQPTTSPLSQTRTPSAPLLSPSGARGTSTTPLGTPRVLSPAAAAAASSAVIGRIGGATVTGVVVGGGRVAVGCSEAGSSRPQQGMGAPAVSTKAASAPTASVYGGTSSSATSSAGAATPLQRRTPLSAANARELPSSGTTMGVHRTVPVSPTKVSVLSGVQRTGGEDPHPRKKMRLEGDVSESAGVKVDNMAEDEEALKRLVLDYRCAQLQAVQDSYREHVAELFFLQNGGNMMEYHMWRKRPPQLFSQFLLGNRLDSSDEEDVSSAPPKRVALAPAGQGAALPGSSSQVQTPTPAAAGGTATSTPLHHAVETLRPSTSTPLPKPAAPTHIVTSHPQSSSSTTTQSVTSIPSPLSRPPHHHHSHHHHPPHHPSSQHPKATPATPATPTTPAPRHSISSVYDNSIGSQEQIVERAKQEAHVVQRIAELQKDGLWSERRLPKVQEPPRTKAHWDYLLEEMVWLAADFAQERKWKKAAAKKCAKMVQKYFQDKALLAQKAEREQEVRLRKLANFMAKEIKTFWNNVEKLVEYKQQTRLEEKRKRALDQHLSFIVDQTEKYSSWLAESMSKSTDVHQQSKNSSVSSRTSSPAQEVHSDEEFCPNHSSTDDEETIAKAEEDVDSQNNHEEEIALLKRESEIPIEELLQNLPQDYLEGQEPSLVNDAGSREESESESDGAKSSRGDDDFEAQPEETDDEATIEEQEEAETTVDHKKEVEELEAENELPIEELLKKYSDLYSEDHKATPLEDVVMNEVKSEDESDEGSVESECESSEEEEEPEVSGELNVGLESLLNDDTMDIDSQKNTSNSEGPGQEITDVAALAESFQPKGNTLSSTTVATKVPFLLKHTLREYQHIGLDWLVTMHDRKLNGILADEMGLGKTIQTIALLAHLACEKGNWGPHLIVVPTSVMLNWEMEIKKWCPAFKILTYYGSQKERKQKRIGWTKPNAFHVCITSYKLVIQDHQSFRRKKWKYLILDEAQNIKNFKSQRWQLLLNFQSQRRLLLTGTPLQNNLMELWSLMHFLMPNVFHSHREFKEWFSNPVTGMIEGSTEYNESIIKRLHKVLRPFLLRRLKCEVEKQLPKKYEHVILCRLSKRQRYLYDDFMSKAMTKETLATGNLLSVINILMQLRKVCNHPNLFDPRPIVSPFQMDGIVYATASIVWNALEYDPFKHIDPFTLNLCLLDLELSLTAFAAHRIKKFGPARRLIEEVDSLPPPPPRCPAGRIKLTVRLPGQGQPVAAPTAATPHAAAPGGAPAAPTPGPSLPSPAPSLLTVGGVQASAGASTIPKVGGGSPVLRAISPQVQGSTQGSPVTLRVSSAGSPQLQGYSLQMVRQQGGIKTIPVAALAPNQTAGSSVTTLAGSPSTSTASGSPRLSVPAGFAQLVQTSTGQHLLLTSTPQLIQGQLQGKIQVQMQGGGSPTSLAAATGKLTVLTSSGQRIAVIPRSLSNTTASVPAAMRLAGGLSSGLIMSTSTAQGLPARPVMRVPPMNASGSQAGEASVSTARLVSVASTSTTPSSKSSGLPVVSSVLNSPNSTLTVINAGGGDHSPAKPTTRSFTRAQEEEAQKGKEQEEVKSMFHLAEIEEHRKQDRRDRLSCLGCVNVRKCQACPIYGSDLVQAMDVVGSVRPTPTGVWRGTGYVHCLNAVFPSNRPERYWYQTQTLEDIVWTPGQLLQSLKDILDRFVFYVPAVSSSLPQLHVCHPSSILVSKERSLVQCLQQEVRPAAASLHPIQSAIATQFPDPRLIQYDCGKLQVLDTLLRHLKTGHHRALIFTQMTRMLDVLEAFLNYHGHIYLRLDGTTRVDQRQSLMERFNADKRIFCFILSTRSGGIGVNLTGADTVIFYDSDWNPTMDAQAQDRCHRIGQTRDVHIYRLVSEKTVEENILKKANQKRLLGDLAIEGGNFTTAYFKTQTIQDLFNVDVSENDPSKRMAEVLTKEEADKSEKETSVTVGEEKDKSALGALESALAAAEDESDVQAARTAKAEAAAELAEFDESIPIEDADATEQEISKVEQELLGLEQQLTPVERYAVRFVESTDEAWSAETLAAAEAEIEQQKREWELGRLQALREEEERQAQLTDDDQITFSQQDAHCQIWISSDGKEEMPMWSPPTPPQDENDVYIDYTMGLLYEQLSMPESQLPPVYLKKEKPRPREVEREEETRRVLKSGRKEDLNTPRSLFDRPTPALMKLRRDVKMQKYRGIARTVLPSVPGLKVPVIVKTNLEMADMGPEWHIHEDWVLLQTVQNLLELPLNLVVISPGHLPNFDMASDLVNNVSHIHRSARHCRNRYELGVMPREEGRLLFDAAAQKQQKKKKSHKSAAQQQLQQQQQARASRAARTSGMFAQDNNAAFTRLSFKRFDVIKAVATKRPTTAKPVVATTPGGTKATKHSSVLTESGICYDAPLTPMQVAANRAERIQRDRHKPGAANSAGQQSAGGVVAAQAGVTPERKVAATVSASVQVSSVATAAPVLGTQAQAAVVVGLQQPQVTAATLGAVVTVAGTTAAVLQPVTTLAPVIRTQRPVATLTVQEMFAAGAATAQVRAGTPVTAATVVASLTPGQVAQRLNTATQSVSAALAAGTVKVSPAVVTTAAAAATLGKNLTPTQIQYFRQQALMRQRLQANQAAVAAAQAVGGNAAALASVAAGKVQVAVTSAGAVQVAQQQRAQLLKQGMVATKPNMAALLKQQQLQQQKAAAVVAAGGAQVQGLTPAQLLAHVGLQVQQQSVGGQSSPVATLVKTVSSASSSGGVVATPSVTIPMAAMGLPQVKTAGGGKVAAGGQQHFRHLAIHHQQLVQQHRKMPQQKVAQLAQVVGMKAGVVPGVPAQLIVQQQPGGGVGGTQKQLPTTVTVQQIQQVIKQVSSGVAQGLTSGVSTAQVISHAVLTKASTQQQSAATLHATQAALASGQTVQARVIPVTGGQQAGVKQTIQVVTASPQHQQALVAAARGGHGQANAASLAALASNMKSAAGGATPQQQQQHALISQVLSTVTAALQGGQPMSVAVRAPSQPVRIQGGNLVTAQFATTGGGQVTLQQAAGAQGASVATTAAQLINVQQLAAAVTTSSGGGTVGAATLMQAQASGNGVGAAAGAAQQDLNQL